MPHAASCRRRMGLVIKTADPGRWARYVFRKGQEEAAEEEEKVERRRRILVCKPCPCGKPCTAHELNPAEAYCSHSLPRMGIHEWTREEMELEEEEQEERSYLDYMELGVGEDLREDRDIPFYLAKTLERCKKVGIATGPQMLNLTVMEELVEGVQRKQVEQKPPSEPQSKEDAVKVQSADESEEPQKEPARKKRR